jgi:hypothetical protein
MVDGPPRGTGMGLGAWYSGRHVLCGSVGLSGQVIRATPIAWPCRERQTRQRCRFWFLYQQRPARDCRPCLGELKGKLLVRSIYPLRLSGSCPIWAFLVKRLVGFLAKPTDTVTRWLQLFSPRRARMACAASSEWGGTCRCPASCMGGRTTKLVESACVAPVKNI